MLHRLTRDGTAILAAVVAPLAVAAVLVPFRGSFSNTNAALVLVVVVVGVAAIGNRLAGALAALSAAVWFDFFLTMPYERFTITRSADVTTAVLLLAVGLAVSQLAARARRLQVIAITDAGYLSQIRHTAELAQSATGPDAVVDLVRDQLTRLLQLSGCRFEYGSLLGHPPRLEQDGTVVSGRTRWDVDRLGLPDQEVELRTLAGGHFYGRFMMRPTPGAAPSLQARLVAVTIANQVGAALNTPRPARDGG
ncbi:DUF4118 domain-containing protein [Actinacidiphila oryziradicis]|uniref:PAS domain-containing sensor histidine kinase n=1 Tax=Actinacidiphila oryziradicis TaxID=2571141 RepID=A0A4V5MZ76_9ACTN|nr:DUF4118 domain-containing protein [Actinacidiphila oryziradicis]TKA01209.1 PAS domain-containing sensor histidine kinase [Actinacidiphila oryziradicis]